MPGVALTEPAAMHDWVQGWTRSRQTPPAVSHDGVLTVQVHDGQESVRRVLTRPTPDLLRHVLAGATEPGACIKLPGDPLQWLDLFPPSWTPEGGQWLMTTQLTGSGPAPASPGYTVSVTDEPGLVVVTVHADGDGEPAASGRIGIAGLVGVPDRISTSAAHRRRGLGRVVMTTLQRAAAEQGASRAVLVASPDGLGLYRSLGWTLLGPVTAADLTP